MILHGGPRTGDAHDTVIVRTAMDSSPTKPLADDVSCEAMNTIFEQRMLRGGSFSVARHLPIGDSSLQSLSVTNMYIGENRTPRSPGVSCTRKVHANDGGMESFTALK